MALRLRALPLALLLACALPFASGARAEDAAPEAPPAEPEAAPKSEKADDTSIFKDWKLVQRRGVAWAKQRAEFWAGKGVTGKDLVWLGYMYERGEVYPKAIETLQAYIDWKPPEGDAKAVETKQKNLEKAFDVKAGAHVKNRDWAGAVAAADAYLALSQANADKMLVHKGRAYRLSGDDAKAIESFQKSAALKHDKGLIELVDVHLCNGDVAAAKSALAGYGVSEAKGKATLEVLSAFVDAVGTAAPSLEKAVAVGSGDSPADWSKPTVLCLWGMQTGSFDQKLKRLEDVRRAHEGEIRAAGVSTYMKYNPESMKVEEGMTTEQEQEWYRKLVAASPVRLPPMIVVPKDVLEALKMKYEGQLVLVDGEGKFRYVRMSNVENYDYQALDLAIRKLTAK